jgi:hypothetical protein
MYQYKIYLIYQLLFELVHHLNIQQIQNDGKYHLWYILIEDQLLDQMFRNVYEFVLLLPRGRKYFGILKEFLEICAYLFW